MTLLTTDEFREFVTTALGDDALQLLLDAAEAEITAAAGPLGAVTELFRGGSRLVVLARPAASITSITERTGSTDLVLETDDYLIHPDQYVIERERYGTNGRSYWNGRTTVVYAAVGDEELRKGVQLDLVRLALNYSPGTTMEQVGSWTRQMSNNATWNADEERSAILSRLDPNPSLVVVGSR